MNQLGTKGDRGYRGFQGPTGPVGGLNDSPDIVLTSPTGGDILSYDQTSSKWINRQPTFDILDFSTVTSFASTGVAYSTLSSGDLYMLDTEDIIRKIS